MKELSDLLGEYEAQRSQYPSLESFTPRLVEFFDRYSKEFAAKRAALQAKRPKVVSMIPPNGASDVDAGLTNIQVVFDRRMKEGSWAMCGGGPNYPETTGKPHYDEGRKTWTVSVKLKPNQDYEFWLNAGQYQAFQSEDGVPLESVAVTFKTGGQAH